MNADDMRRWRKRLGLSQAQAAALIGCGERSIQNYERGVPIPRYIALACSAVALGVPPYGKEPE